MVLNWQKIILMGLPKKEITMESIREFMVSEATKRINFASSHANALKKAEPDGGKITLPFSDTIQPIIENKLGADKRLFPSQYGGIWRGIHTNEEYAEFEEFKNKYDDIVFLRDNLDLSIALSMNYEGDERTEIGELEYQAKFNNDESAEEELIDKCKEWIEELPFYKHADHICAMPSSNADEESLPKRIVNSLTDLDFTDISKQVLWSSKTRKVKDAETIEEKLEILEESGLVIEDDLNIQGKTIILFDDLYMSGISTQYVAMKLKEAGADRVFGLSIVKSRSNTAR